MPSRRLAFEYCQRCALIRQAADVAMEPDYSEVVRRTKRQLPDYTVGILGALRGYAGPEELVIEVGANDGSFLEHLRAAGFRRLLGIEPSRELASLCVSSGHAMENQHLALDTATAIVARHGAARALICRHTLEHVPDPFAFLRAARELLCEDGVIYIEVPAAAPIVEQLHAHELWDEHISYFSPANLRQLARRAGLVPLHSVQLDHRSSVNLGLWARRAPIDNAVIDTPDVNFLSACATFAARWHDHAAHLRAQAEQWRHPVIAMGASHPQSNFLLFSGLGSSVDVLVDDDESKAGRYVALPRPTPIFSTRQILADARNAGTLILSAFGYGRWGDSLGKTLSARGYDIVDPEILRTAHECTLLT